MRLLLDTHAVPLVAGRKQAGLVAGGARRARSRRRPRLQGARHRVDDAQKAGQLPEIHRDPFDRMLIAQAMERNMALVSKDAEFDGYGVNRLW